MTPGDHSTVDQALLAKAKQLDGELPPPAAAEPGAAGADRPAGMTDYAAEAQGLIDFVFHGVSPVYPSIAPIYPPEVRARLAATAAPLMEKYNLTLGAIFEKWAKEIAFGMVALPLIAPTVQAIRADRAAARKAAEEAEAKARAGAPA